MAAAHQDEIVAGLLLLLYRGVTVPTGGEVAIHPYIELEIELRHQGLDDGALSGLVHGLQGEAEGALQLFIS